MEAEQLFELVSGSIALPVTTDEQDAALDALLDDVRDLQKLSDEKCEAEYRPHKTAGDLVKANYKPVATRLGKAREALIAHLTPYRAKKKADADKAARELLEAAAAKERAAQEVLRQSDDLEQRFDAEQALEAASRLSASAKRIERAATGLRTQSVAVVNDHAALLKHIKAHDADTLKAWLAEYARKALPACLPGCEIKMESKAI